MTLDRKALRELADIELRANPSFILLDDPTNCDHAWESHLWEHGRAYCPCCGSFARWVDDPRLEERRD